MLLLTCIHLLLQPFWANRWFVAAMAFQLTFLLYLLFSPGDWLTGHFAQIVHLPLSMHAVVFALLALNFIVACGIDATTQMLIPHL